MKSMSTVHKLGVIAVSVVVLAARGVYDEHGRTRGLNRCPSLRPVD